MNFKLIFLIFGIATFNLVHAGPIAVGICYAGCAGLACACFTAAGATFGTVLGAAIAATPALAACNTAFAECEAACMAALVTPTP